MAETFPPEFFRRIDETDDELFYSQPRLVVHIDEGAIKKVGEIYARLLPQSGAILDLMSSWRSHLPEKTRPVRLVGLGMNRPEMEDNPALTQVAVHDLNRDPRFRRPARRCYLGNVDSGQRRRDGRRICQRHLAVKRLETTCRQAAKANDTSEPNGQATRPILFKPPH